MVLLWMQTIISLASYYKKMSSGVLEINSYILSDDKDYRCKKRTLYWLEGYSYEKGDKIMAIMGVMNYTAGIYSRSVNRQVKSSQTERTSFADKIVQKRESVVDQYKRKHPKDVSHVNAQVRAGKSVIAKNGVENVSREDMTMEEYKAFINGLLSSIPFDSTRIYDKEYVSISEAGWEQMKNDPDYEAWVLGYTAENRSVRNPFFGLPGASANICVEKFGASIEEHLGQSVGTSGLGGSSNKVKNEKSWWEKRQEKMEELMEEQALKALKKAQAQRAFEQERYLNSRLVSQQRLQSFLSGSTQGSEDMMAFQSAAATAYEANISTFSKSIIGSREI